MSNYFTFNHDLHYDEDGNLITTDLEESSLIVSAGTYHITCQFGEDGNLHCHWRRVDDESSEAARDE
jgi:hypothetical protein